MSRVVALVVVITALSAGQAAAQSWEMSALAGYAPAAELERQSREVDNAAIGGGFLFSIQAARFLTANWGIEASFTQQYSSYDLTMGGTTATLFGIDVVQIHGDVVYQFGEPASRLRPFVLAGLGAAFLSANDLATETKFSAAVGGGAKLFLSEQVGIRAQVNYRPLWLGGNTEGDFCDPFGFCQSMLNRIEFAAGVSLKF